MKYTLIILLTLVLTACGGGGGGSSSSAPSTQTPNVPVQPFLVLLFASDRIDDYTPRHNIPIRWGDFVSDDMKFDTELVDTAVDELETCLGDTVDVSEIYILLNYDESCTTGQVDCQSLRPAGITHIPSSHIFIAIADAYDPYYTLEVVKHEIIHVYLNQHGFDVDLNIAHRSDFFPYCTDLPWRAGYEGANY